MQGNHATMVTISQSCTAHQKLNKINCHYLIFSFISQVIFVAYFCDVSASYMLYKDKNSVVKKSTSVCGVAKHGMIWYTLREWSDVGGATAPLS